VGDARLPPRWYKDPASHLRIVREPRRVLAEFGVQLEPDIEVRVWDSSAEATWCCHKRPRCGCAARDELVPPA
jgi:hypothetical protein